MSKKIMLIALGIGLLFGSSVYADEMAQCSMKKQGKSDCQSQCPIADKLLKKSHFLLEHKTDLGLTEDQVKKVKDIKLTSEKDAAQQGADAKTFMLDLKSNLEQDKIDVEGTNAFIDKSFAAFANAAKSNVEAYAKLKSVLTPEQAAKMKELHKDKKESWKKSEGKEGHKHQ